MERVLGYTGGQPSPLRQRILRSNGIYSRHYAIDPNTREFTHSNADLTAEAVRSLEDDGASIDDMEALVCGTTTPDQLMPGHALMVQGLLGISDFSCHDSWNLPQRCFGVGLRLDGGGDRTVRQRRGYWF